MGFQKIILLHGKGGSPEGSVKDLEAGLRDHYRGQPADLYYRPRLLHADAAVPAEQSLTGLQAMDVPRGAVLIGVSLGGLLAAKLQEAGREDLRVVCLNSPTWADGVTLERRMPDRLAFYSSTDDVIAGRTANWPRLAMAFDLPWLTHDTSMHAKVLTPLIIAYLENQSVPHAIEKVEKSLGGGNRPQ
ncbi:MAG: alpha/beta hydrolase [Candidatus Korobacteraceae bacterium]